MQWENEEILTLFFTFHVKVSRSTSPTPSPLQVQYVFIHDSLSELVMCGETEIAAGDLRIKMMSLQKPVAGDPSGLIGYHKEFEVLLKHL